MAHSGVAFAPLVQATGEGLKLSMQRLWLTGRLLPVGARLLVRHVFRSSERKPVEVIYAFALPRDAALRRFRISGEGFSVRSELKPVREAVELYEKGLAQGSLATLAREYGDGLVNLTVGNIRPGETVTVDIEALAGVDLRDDGLRFRFPFTLAPAYHAKARATEREPGLGEVELPEDEFGDAMLPQWKADASGLHEVGFDLAVAFGAPISEISSPSHAVRVRSRDASHWRVGLATGGDVPDRDLVLDVRRAGQPAVLAETGSNGRTTFAAVVPSTVFGQAETTPRQVVFVLDRSGSMGGAPMVQALRAIEACLGALSASDRFGIVTFDNRVESLAPELVHGDMAGRERAQRFLAGIDARGSTELGAGVAAAAAMLTRHGGDLFVVTDGQVFGTETILGQARASGIRLHCLGIGSASQDRFLALLARETGGVSRFVTPGERVDMAALDLFASAGRTVASDVRCAVDGEGAIRPEPPAAVFPGMPLLVFGDRGGVGGGTLLIRWQGGERSVALPADAPKGETLRLLQGSRLITDLGGRIPAEGRAAKRESDRVDLGLEELSRLYGLASRRMALVAVVERAGDRPGEVPSTRVVPVGMPQGTEFEAYFARQAPQALAFYLASPNERTASSDVSMLAESCASMFSRERREPPRPDSSDALLDLARLIEPDGGMPGANERERAAASVLALLFFVADGHSVNSGPFRLHVRRLIEFLERTAPRLPDRERAHVRRVIVAAHSDLPIAGNWRRLKPQEVWDALDTSAAKS